METTVEGPLSLRLAGRSIATVDRANRNCRQFGRFGRDARLLRKCTEVAGRLVGQAVEWEQLHRSAAKDISPVQPDVAEVCFGLDREDATVFAGEFDEEYAALVANAEYGRLSGRGGGDQTQPHSVREAVAVRVGPSTWG